MASIPAPVSLPSPVTWGQHPKTRARLIAAAVLAAAYVGGLADGTPTRKRQDASAAPAIQRNVPPDTIHQPYLHQIDLGAGAHGVDAAAQVYFGKSARALNVPEAGTIAAIPHAQTTYNPRLHPARS